MCHFQAAIGNAAGASPSIHQCGSLVQERLAGLIMLMSDVGLNGASVPLLLIKSQPLQPGQCAISLTCAAGRLSCMCLTRLEAAASHAAVKKISAEWVELLLCSCTAQLKSTEDAQRSSGPFSGSSGTCSSALQRHRGAKSE